LSTGGSGLLALFRYANNRRARGCEQYAGLPSRDFKLS